MRAQAKRPIKIIIATVAACALMMAFVAPSAWAKLTIKANHDNVEIGYNYHGSNVSLSGTADKGVDLIFKIASENGSEKLMRKDKVAGFLWMNVEEVHFNNIPEVYFLLGTRNPAELLSPEKLKASGISYGGISDNAEITPLSSPDKRPALFSEFIKYQESKNSYLQSFGGIDMKPEEDGQSYFTSMEWPSKVAPGEYEVTAFAVKDGNIVDTAKSKVSVENVGEVKALSNMATNNGALYGAAAVVVAIAAGFGVGIVFRSGGGAH